jgi:hypothetical protein
MEFVFFSPEPATKRQHTKDATKMTKWRHQDERTGSGGHADPLEFVFFFFKRRLIGNVRVEANHNGEKK